MAPSRVPPQSILPPAAAAAFNPAVETGGLTFRDHRSNECLATVWIALNQRGRFSHQLGFHYIVNVFMNHNALNADARLTRLIESTENNSVDGIIEIFCIRINDNRRIATKLQDNLLSCRNVLSNPNPHRVNQ